MPLNPSSLICSLLLFFTLALTACRWPWEKATDSNLIVLAGTVEAREIELAFQVPGRIEQLRVDEGHEVAAGQVVATLDVRDYQLALQNAEAQAEAARAALAALQAGSRRQEVAVAQAALASAEADLRFAESEVRRIAELMPRHLVARERLDQVRLQRDIAQARLAQAGQTLELLREGSRREDIERAAADYRSRRVAVEIAARQLGYAELKSARDGVVAVRLAEPGEVVGAGRPVLRIAELARPWIRAYLSETDLARVKLGQTAQVRVDGLPGQVFQGRLGFIAPQAEFTPKTVETRELRADLVYRIKVEVDNPEGRLKLGMLADVVLEAVAAP